MRQPNPATKLSLFLVLLGTLVLAACGAPGPAAPAATNPSEAPVEAPNSRLTDNGLYRISFTSALDPIAINELHSWTLHVETAEGQPVDDAQITVDGGMPAHGHGLPTQPQVTQNLGNGDYLLEGVRFQMPGAWVMRFDVAADGQSDGVTFELALR
jgi:hypothetical protein